MCWRLSPTARTGGACSHPERDEHPWGHLHPRVSSKAGAGIAALQAPALVWAEVGGPTLAVDV